MRALELIGGVVVAWVLAVGTFARSQIFLIGRRRANDDGDGVAVANYGYLIAAPWGLWFSDLCVVELLYGRPGRARRRASLRRRCRRKRTRPAFQISVHDVDRRNPCSPADDYLGERQLRRQPIARFIPRISNRLGQPQYHLSRDGCHKCLCPLWQHRASRGKT